MGEDSVLSYALNYNQDMELSVVGACFIDPRFLDRVAGRLNVDDFMNPTCAALFGSASSAWNNGNALDPIAAQDVIRGKVPDAAKYITDCMLLCPSVTAAEGHADYIHSSAKDRRLRSKIDEAMSDSAGDELATKIAGICQDYISGKLGRSYTLAQTLDSVMDALGSPPANRLDTGFKRMDALLMGMRGGDIVIVAARPGVGKSVFAQNIAIRTAATGKTVLLYSLEMRHVELGERILSNASGVRQDDIITHNLSDQSWQSLNSACERLYQLPMIINDDPRVTVSKIRAEARVTKNLGLIVIDYITLLTSEEKYANRNLEVGALSRALKVLAMELDVPIILLSQLNRESSDTDKPKISELRDSGNLEQDASKIIFLWNVDEEQGIKGVSIAKNRYGRCGVIQMRFKGDNMFFSELPQDMEVWKASTSTRRGKNKWADDD